MARDGAIVDMASLIKMYDIVNFRMHVHVGILVFPTEVTSEVTSYSRNKTRAYT